MNKVIYPQLYELYIVKQLPMWKIAKELNVAIGTIFNYLKKYEIPTRNQAETFTMKGKKLTEIQVEKIRCRMKGRTVSVETRQKMSEAKKLSGKGHKKYRCDGYIAIYFPEHPKSAKDGYIMEHILIVESTIGRHLKENECVHHINGNRSDNRVENLKLMTKSEHMSYHSKRRWELKKGE